MEQYLKYYFSFRADTPIHRGEIRFGMSRVQEVKHWFLKQVFCYLLEFWFCYRHWAEDGKTSWVPQRFREESAREVILVRTPHVVFEPENVRCWLLRQRTKLASAVRMMPLEVSVGKLLLYRKCWSWKLYFKSHDCSQCKNLLLCGK